MECGFDGSYSCDKHPFIAKRDFTLSIPNPKKKVIIKCVAYLA